MTLSPLLLLSPADNVLVCRIPVEAGDRLEIDGRALIARHAVDAGHKIARRNLGAGEKVIKYGAPIGSMTADASAGDHIHLHNMKSDYIETHSRETASTARRAS